MLDGYKAKIGAAGSVLSGISMLIQAFVTGDFSLISEAVGLISLGLAAYGLRVAKK